MDDPILHFLFIYDRRAAKLIDSIEFGEDGDAAVAAYGPMERRYMDKPNIEVVLLGSDSLETLKVTHGNYFDPADWFVEDLARA